MNWREKWKEVHDASKYTLISVRADDLVLTNKITEWCKLPYPGHPNGCPNYGKKIGCPPQSQRLDKVFDFKKTMWLVISRFDLDKWMRKMKQKHPEWSDRQCRCCLYWQGKVRKWLKNGLSVLKKCYYGGTTYTLCPEGMGLNVIRTLKRLGIPIRAKPRDVVYKVAMFGYEKDRLIK